MPTKVGLSGCYRNFRSYKVENIYYMVLYRKSLPTWGLGSKVFSICLPYHHSLCLILPSKPYVSIQQQKFLVQLSKNVTACHAIIKLQDTSVATAHTPCCLFLPSNKPEILSQRFFPLWKYPYLLFSPEILLLLRGTKTVLCLSFSCISQKISTHILSL